MFILVPVLPPKSFRFSPALMVTMVLWGFNFVALKLILKQMTPSAAALVRAVMIFALLLVFCWIRKVSVKYPKKDSLPILFQGFLAMGAYMVCFFYGMQNSSAGEGAIILATAPIFTFLIAVAAKQERFSGATLIGIIVAFAGVTIVIVGGLHPNSGVAAADVRAKLIGNLVILLGAVLWALSAVISKPIITRHDPLRLFTLSMPGGIAVLLPWGFRSTMAVDWAKITPLSCSMLLYMAVMAGAVGFILFYKGVEQVGASKAMVYQYFVSPIAAFSDYLVNGTKLSWMQAVGLMVVIVGVAATSITRRAAAGAPAQKPV